MSDNNIIHKVASNSSHISDIKSVSFGVGYIKIHGQREAPIIDYVLERYLKDIINSYITKYSILSPLLSLSITNCHLSADGVSLLSQVSILSYVLNLCQFYV
jgi:hypothetical protein